VVIPTYDVIFSTFTPLFYYTKDKKSCPVENSNGPNKIKPNPFLPLAANYYFLDLDLKKSEQFRELLAL